MDIKATQSKIAEFARERAWDQFHNPKNLAVALSVECSELLELFQWLTPEQSASIMSDPSKAQKVKDEIADITVYLLRLADKLDVDLETVVPEKMIKNSNKYPVSEFKGSARKYNEEK